MAKPTLYILGFLLVFSLGIFFESLIVMILSFTFVVLLILSNKSKGQKQIGDSLNKFKVALSENKFTPTDSHLGDDQLSAIALDEEANKIAVLKRNKLDEDFKIKILNFNDIVESSLNEDGETLIKTSRGSQVGGALIGGALAGSTGAIIAGLGANKTSRDKVSKINLQIVVDDLSSPVHEINFLTALNPLDKSHQIYRETERVATKWHKILSVIINRKELNIKSI
jgi:hypothetical protein